MTRKPEEIEKLPYRQNVGVMLVNSDDRVFVGRRIDMKGPHWQMPQGGIDPGESPEEAALRELEEETGVSRDLVWIVQKTRVGLPMICRLNCWINFGAENIGGRNKNGSACGF